MVDLLLLFSRLCLQQLLREMQQMASRPFATINVALEADEEPPDLIGGNVKVRVFFFILLFYYRFFLCGENTSTGLLHFLASATRGHHPSIPCALQCYCRVTIVPTEICSTATPVSWQVTCRVVWRQD